MELLQELRTPSMDLLGRALGACSFLISCLVRRRMVVMTPADWNVRGLQPALRSRLHLAPIQPADHQHKLVSFQTNVLLFVVCIASYWFNVFVSILIMMWVDSQVHASSQLHLGKGMYIQKRGMQQLVSAAAE